MNYRVHLHVHLNTDYSSVNREAVHICVMYDDGTYSAECTTATEENLCKNQVKPPFYQLKRQSEKKGRATARERMLPRCYSTSKGNCKKLVTFLKGKVVHQ